MKKKKERKIKKNENVRSKWSKRNKNEERILRKNEWKNKEQN